MLSIGTNTNSVGSLVVPDPISKMLLSPCEGSGEGSSRRLIALT
ncbi:MAG: hypothetical protein NT023_13035 [Armatimonadetes bacterium]|nr:hypothetical protein [Armatimonadota bacterium]